MESDEMDLQDMSLRDRVHAVLRWRLGRCRGDTGTLEEIAVDDGTRQIIARAIRLEFPNLRPQWSDADMRPESTVDSLAAEIGRRRVTARCQPARR